MTKKLYKSAMYDRNIDKYGLIDEQCVCCGKPMKDDSNLFVHLNSNGEAVSPAINEDECASITGYDSQGLFPIGNDCAKKMKGFVHQMA